MKKILHVAVTLTGEGIANYLYNYFTHIDLKEFKIDIIINNTEEKGIYEEALFNLGINIIKVTSYEKSTKKWIRDIEQIMKNNEYDICECHIGVRSNFICKVAKKYNIKTRIIHTHIAYEPEKKYKKFFRIALNNLYSKYVTNYFGCSYDSLQWTFGKLLCKKRSYVINNAIDINKFKYSKEKREKYRKMFNIEKNFVIGCVGRLCYQKNQLFLIDVFYEITKMDNDSKLVLIGDGPDKNEIIKKIKHYNLENKVILTGIRSDVCDFLNAFDAFVLPSRYEGFGIVYLEAEINNLSCFGTKERVPENVKISRKMHFISEKKCASEWGDIILNQSKFQDRIDDENYEKYDINKQSKILENIYRNI